MLCCHSFVLYSVGCFRSGVERGDEIYSLCQVPAAVQDKPSSEQRSLPQQQQQQEEEAVVKKPSSTEKVFRPKCLVDSATFLLPAGDGPVPLDVNDKNGPPPTKTVVATTIATTANVIKRKQQTVCSSESPKATTAKIFAPRTEDMNKGFLTFSDDDTGLTSECPGIIVLHVFVGTSAFSCRAGRWRR